MCVCVGGGGLGQGLGQGRGWRGLQTNTPVCCCCWQHMLKVNATLHRHTLTPTHTHPQTHAHTQHARFMQSAYLSKAPSKNLGQIAVTVLVLLSALQRRFSLSLFFAHFPFLLSLFPSSVGVDINTHADTLLCCHSQCHLRGSFSGCRPRDLSVTYAFSLPPLFPSRSGMVNC